MHTNPSIARVHNEFSGIRYELSSFFTNYDRDLIRFQFGETPTQFQFRVKFSSTHRSIRFTVNKDSPEKANIEKLEKTTDIISDIDRINIVIGTEKELSLTDSDFKVRIAELFLWGLTRNPNRKREIFRAPAVFLPNWNPDIPNELSKDVLYFDLIMSHEVVSKPDNEGFIEVKLNLFQSDPYFITCPEYYLENIRRGRILIVNWLERYNVMNFSSAKHHLDFKDADYHAISKQLIQFSNENEKKPTLSRNEDDNNEAESSIQITGKGCNKKTSGSYHAFQ